jgi:hypothetical protein
VEDFPILLFHGKPGKPNHTGKVKEFPDVLHIGFEELQKKVFRDLGIQSRVTRACRDNGLLAYLSANQRNKCETTLQYSLL